MNLAHSKSTSSVRIAAAVIASVSGLGQIAALWLRDLSGAAVGDALLGAVYLLIAIGLFGTSRLSLFLAAIVPAAAAISAAARMPHPEDFTMLRIALDLSIIVFSTLELWRTRHNAAT